MFIRSSGQTKAGSLAHQRAAIQIGDTLTGSKKRMVIAFQHETSSLNRTLLSPQLFDHASAGASEYS
jgi:hypothetical protein